MVIKIEDKSYGFGREGERGTDGFALPGTR
jgi:hypothetical protein